MAYPVSLQTLIQRVRQRANLEGATAFITDLEITDHINISIAKWYDNIRQSSWGGQYYRSAYPFLTVPSTLSSFTNPPQGAYYPLPSDYLSMISVDIFITPNTVISARMFQEEQRNIFRWYPIGWLYSQPIYYQIWQNNIVFNPGPQQQFHVNLNYVPTAPSLSDGADTLDSINGWEEAIVLDAAIKCLIKDGQIDLIPSLEGRLQQEWERILIMAPRRDTSQAEEVHMIAQQGSDDWFY